MPFSTSHPHLAFPFLRVHNQRTSPPGRDKRISRISPARAETHDIAMWILLALGTAFFQAVKDMLIKKCPKVEGVVLSWAYCLPTSVLLLVHGLATGDMPDLGERTGEFFAVLLMGAAFNTLAFRLYFSALKHSDLSLSTPMLAFTPVFMCVTSPVILGEYPGPGGMAGIGLVVLGAYMLNLKQRKTGFLGPLKAVARERGSRYMLIVAFIWSVSANFDKIGLTMVGPSLWLGCLFFCIWVAFTPLVLARYRDKIAAIPGHAGRIGMMSMAEAVSLFLQMLALSLAIVPYVIAVKRLSAVFGVLFAGALLGEKGMAERLAGAVLMVLGVAAITLFG